jgi:hypothetical protein
MCLEWYDPIGFVGFAMLIGMGLGIALSEWLTR